MKKVFHRNRIDICIVTPNLCYDAFLYMIFEEGSGTFLSSRK